MSEVIDLLSTIEDPRVLNKIIYPMPTLLFISICAFFCGAESWDDIVVFAESRREWLSGYVDLSERMPCYSTFRRLFSTISPSVWSTLIERYFGVGDKGQTAGRPYTY